MKNIFKDIWDRFNLTKNTTQKLISLLFAIVFWIFVMDIENPEIIKTFNRVPIDFLGIEQLADEQLEIFGEYTRAIDVKVKGRRKEVLAMTQDDIRITVDLYRATEGEGKFSIMVTLLNDDISIESIEKSIIELSFDGLTDKEMPIEIVQKGSVEAPYIFGGVSSVPKDVVVSGPRRFVDKVTRVVAHIDLTEARSTFEWVSTLVPLDENNEVVNKVTLSSKETKLIANIMEEKTVRIVPLIVDELPLGYKLISATLDNQLVTLVGITEVIDQLDGVTIEPISLKDRTESKAEEVILSLPAGVTESVESVHVLNLEIEAVVERSFSPTSDQITWLNQAENTEVAITDPQLLEIVLSGVESQINQIELEDIKLLIEISEKAPGEYILPVTLVVDADVEWLLPVEERQVNVLITESKE